MKRLFLLSLIPALLLYCLTVGTTAFAMPEVPVKGKVTLVDIGTTTCLPCRMMMPVLEGLKKDFQGRAEIIFNNVSKDKTLARKLSITGIPAQIIWDRDGKEVYRHLGYIPKENLAAELEKYLGEKARP